MKKLIALLLIVTLLLSACSPANMGVNTDLPTDVMMEIEVSLYNIAPFNPNSEIVFTHLGDPNLLRYMEDSVYATLVTLLDSDDFFVENVSAIFLSNEYLEQLAFNSLENIFFGYTLSELDSFFQGSRYIFTLGEDGKTTVQVFERYDDTFDRIIRNVAIGTGVILLCVTVALVAPVAGATAISVIFAKSATTGAIGALSGGVVSGGIAGVVTGITTGNIDEALTAAALAASEGIKWGAISGSIFGGAQTAIALRGATKNGLTMNQAATIQRETNLPLDVIRQFQTVDEAMVFADMRTIMLNGKAVLVPRGFDLNYVDPSTISVQNPSGLTNLQLMQRGRNIIDPRTGFSYEWHHVGGRADGTLALLTREQHDIPALHRMIQNSEINRATFNIERQALNRALAQLYGG